jgi:hypothetical protein
MELDFNLGLGFFLTLYFQILFFIYILLNFDICTVFEFLNFLEVFYFIIFKILFYNFFWVFYFVFLLELFFTFSII